MHLPTLLLAAASATLALASPTGQKSCHSSTRAIAHITPDPTYNATTVSGTVTLTQKRSSPHVTLNLHLTGLAPGLHGFHVHANGVIAPNCTAAGPHFNPHNVTHGGPDSTVRHVGDLGNVRASAGGEVKVTIVDGIVKLVGDVDNIVGKAIVIHALEDDLGLGNATTSKTTGNAGARVACGVITLV
ncbi:CRE-SOD-1 protein [Fimicolochytrium jonesii]|uniref:CRE-SOD-1 protein n=1 Tax=Fimicolochytrium jonesii TaxID=1396493 RepID=UPI0022FEDA1D|nr:CRE-SOD-1 protein [Fimicolochytrium jonesii]KAI8816313.1 CRE-SOD-1 protein [Fimicolochytrium jonesii]